MIKVTESDNSGKKRVVYLAKNYKEAEEWIMEKVDEGVKRGEALSYDWKEVNG